MQTLITIFEYLFIASLIIGLLVLVAFGLFIGYTYLPQLLEEVDEATKELKKRGKFKL